MTYDWDIDYFAILGITNRDATTAEIVQQYDNIRIKTPEIEEAFEVLSNESRRAAYLAWNLPPVDVQLAQPPDPIMPAEDDELLPVPPEPDSLLVSLTKRFGSCLFYAVFGVVVCAQSIRAGLSGSFGTAVLLAAIPIAFPIIVRVVKGSKNRRRLTITTGVVLTIAVVVILVLQAALQPVFKGPQDIINSITSAGGSVLTIEKTLAVSGNAQALAVPATATSSIQQSEVVDLCKKLPEIMHFTTKEITIDPQPQWLSNNSFNIFVYWSIDGGDPTEIDPAKDKKVVYTLRKPAETVKLAYVLTLEHGKSKRYNCQ